MDTARREASLRQLREMLPASAPWERWLEKTGELPPDFDAMPSRAELPDPLEGVSNPASWQARKAELRALFARWILGACPARPDNLTATILEERSEPGAISRSVRLAFGPEHKATLRLELLIPHGKGPFPVFMTQHNHRDWALIALRRGYLGCVYSGADSQDDTDTFVNAYPDYDWSRLMRRAWAASRCVDYLETVPEANVREVLLTGHSRNGKVSLMAGAFDERIAAVISSSSGAGGCLTTRDHSEQHAAEGIEFMTRVFPDWFHPRLRFFVGREQKLPVDLNELPALIAPRACLLSTALNDNVESTWAQEQTYLSARNVYRMLDAPDRLRIMWRPGAHETDPTDIEAYLDWSDAQFGRSKQVFAERFVYPCDWEAWRKSSSETSPEVSAVNSAGKGPASPEKTRAAMYQMLGDAPPEAANPGNNYGLEPAHIASMVGRSGAGDGIEKAQVMFGEYISADVYVPAGLEKSGRRAPAVLWLHPFSFPCGYAPSYRRGEPVYRALARQGFVVFCFDQIGCGRRVEEAERFYDRYPHWSLLGKMVRDSHAAIEVLAKLPYVDSKRVFGLGYSLGALVGLHLAADDTRLTGLAVVCAPPPFRTDTNVAETGGIRRWSHRYLLMPRLGFYAGHEASMPYDMEDLYAAFAPRPLLVVSPQLDREAPLAAVSKAVEAARAVYQRKGAGSALEQLSPDTYNQFGPDVQEPVFAWLKARAMP